MSEALIPADHHRCQVEYRGGSFMTFGPRPMVRCTAMPIIIARDPTTGGEMSMCGEHLDAFRKHGNPDLVMRAEIRIITENVA